MMKPFELAYRCCEPGLPAIYGRIRKTLKEILRGGPATMRVLDIGGRKSHYTIGISAKVTLTDLPRCDSLQHHLHLGITQEMISEIQKRRSNVEQVVIDDMTHSRLNTGEFDCAIAIEVLEHVEDDTAFIREVRRVLAPKGVFVMTTPNGDSVTTVNPDHKRHYRRCELEALLRTEFASVDVRYAIPATRYYDMALQSWSLRRPMHTMKAIVGAVINSIEDRRAQQPANGKGMQQLFVVARKAN